MFALGRPVKGGVYGDHPSLRRQDLDQGDLKFHTDFRSVYSTILTDWLKADSNKILGRKLQDHAAAGLDARNRVSPCNAEIHPRHSMRTLQEEPRVQRSSHAQ